MMNTITKENNSWAEKELKSFENFPVEVIDITIGYRRLSYIFQIEIHKISAEFKFGQELKASFFSIIKNNELDEIGYDIEDFESILYPQEVNKVESVKDYVTLLAMCRVADNDQYKTLITDWENLYHANSFGRFIKKYFGILPKKKG